MEYTPFPQRRNERRNKCMNWDVFPAVAIVVDHSLPILSDYAYSKKVKSLTEMKKTPCTEYGKQYPQEISAPP